MPPSRSNRPFRPTLARWRWPRRPAPFWILAVALATLTALATTRLVSQAEADAARWGTVRPTLVALRDLEPGAVLDTGDAQVRALPEVVVPAGALGEEAAGATVAQPIRRGEPVLSTRLAPAGLSAPAARLPPGTRGVAVPSDGSGLRLALGDVVDVLATVEADDLGGTEPAFAVARSAEVVDVAEEAVTVAVDREQAPRVAFALTAGVVTLVLSAER